jgi:ATP/maltotriose-dependent transcriptional regulator MalT
VSLLRDTGEIGEVRQRYASCMFDRVQALESRAAHEVIEANYAGIQAALDWAWARPDEQLFLRWVTMLMPYWRRSCHLEEGWLWLNRAVDLAQTQDELAEHRAMVLIGAATMARRRGDFRWAEPAANESLREARKAGDSHGIARALNSLGAIALQQSHLEKARSFYQRALSQYRLQDDTQGEAAVLHNIALVTLVEHEIHQAVEIWERALPLARKLDDKTALIAALRTLGSIRLAQGRVDCARRSLQEALLCSQRSHDLFDTMLCHTILTRVFSESRHFDLMATHAREAMLIARDSGDPIGLVLSLIGQARVEIERGEIEVADAHLVEAHEAASRFGEPIAYQPVLQAMADLRRWQGEVRGAFDLYEESFRYWLRGGDLMTLVPLLLGFADVASRLGQREAARRMLEVVGAVQVMSGMCIPAAYRDVYRDLGGTLDLSPTHGRQEGAGLPGRGLRDLIDGIFDDVPAPLLSGRERAVLGLLANGHTNAQMAEHLFVSPHTINTHVRRIYQKIGVNSRSAATRFALERGMVVESSANA